MANATLVAAGKPKITGGVWRAPAGTTLPTDASTALGTGFVCLGYVSEDGVTLGVTRESDDIKAWGGDTVMTTQTEFSETFKFTLIETLNIDVKKAVFGDANVTGTLASGMTTTVNSTELPEAVWVFEMVQNGAACRIVVPNGKLSEMGDVTFNDSDPIGYEITITALPDTNGNVSYEYVLKA
jgi:hypothetical protein